MARPPGPRIWRASLGMFGLMLSLGNVSQTAALTCPAVYSPPDFVLTYAPLVWLHSQDPYRPSDIGAQLAHTTPEKNFTVVGAAPSPLTLDNLDQLNGLGGADVYLTAKEGIKALPDWLKGVTPNGSGKTDGAVSSTIVITDHGGGTVDAFYFYFYAYNAGPEVSGTEYGDHVGDWEHNMIRFRNGHPESIWYSQHASGQAFTYHAAEKKGVRPYAYSAKGSHAVYAVAGTHDHAIPGVNLPAGFLEDFTDRGILWDPTLSTYVYSYDVNTKAFTPYDSRHPVRWLSFEGHWGDQQLPDNTPGQVNTLGQRRYVSGPDGPKFKALDRKHVCPVDTAPCLIFPFVTI